MSSSGGFLEVDWWLTLDWSRCPFDVAIDWGGWCFKTHWRDQGSFLHSFCLRLVQVWTIVVNTEKHESRQPCQPFCWFPLLHLLGG
jgi:hypothetical protein